MKLKQLLSKLGIFKCYWCEEIKTGSKRDDFFNGKMRKICDDCYDGGMYGFD